MMDNATLWTADDVARFLRASRSLVYKLAERGELPCFRIGALLRFDPVAVRAWIDARRAGGDAPGRVVALPAPAASGGGRP